MSIIEQIHGKYVFNRRVHLLSDHLANLLPQDAKLLDVGCGDGTITHLIEQKRSDIKAQGIDVLVRNQTHIPVTEFDGQVMPYSDSSFDVVMFVDVLHHTEDAMILLREALRVARKAIVIKDHTCDGFLADLTLRFMDKVGNERHGVVLPYNYWSEQQWFNAFDTLGLRIGVWHKKLRLYPTPASWIFDRSLHFIARLDLN